MASFVVQEHWATRHNFDFRLEMDGVLKSWAVPKGPPTEPRIKRLAMQVEDHPLEYGSFQGTIGKGQYGAGRVEIWDHGEYELSERAPRKLRFTLHGEKLQGEYELILFKEEEERSMWLLFKSQRMTIATQKRLLLDVKQADGGEARATSSFVCQGAFVQ